MTLIHESKSSNSYRSVNRLHLVSCIGVDHELNLLPHFLRHYLGLGIERHLMHFILQSNDSESSNLERAKDFLQDYEIDPRQLWRDRYTSASMWERRRSLQAQYVPDGDWVLNADVDELHAYPATPRCIVEFCVRREILAVQGVMIDRLSKNSKLVSVNDEESIDKQFPICADVMCSVAGKGQFHDQRGTVKLMLHSGSVFPGIGGHCTHSEIDDSKFLIGQPLANHPDICDPGFRFVFPFQVHHFKWTSTLGLRLKRRLATPGITNAGLEYDSKILNLVNGSGVIEIPEGAIMQRKEHRNEDWRRTVTRYRHQRRWIKQICALKLKSRSLLKKIFPYRLSAWLGI